MLNIFLYLGAGLKTSTWTDLTIIAGKLFWNISRKNHSNEKVSYMIGQMASFKCFESYYSTKYSSSFIKPKIWWQMINDPDDSLKSLALKLFSMTPHSATCERAFSMLNLLYGKRRQCLNISTIEMMAKIRFYLLSNTTKELNHLAEETELELKTLIQECGFFNEEDDDDDDDDLIDDDFYYVDDDEIPSHEVHVLIINNMVDLNNTTFNGEFEREINDNNSSDDDDDDDEEELDFEVIASISAPPNM